MPVDTLKIRKLREKRGLTLQAAADAAGFVNRQQWWKIEAADSPDLRISTLISIAKVLGVGVADLLKQG